MIPKRAAVVAAIVATSVGLLATPAQAAATPISTFAPSEAGGLFCSAVEQVFEDRRAQTEGHPGDWYYCERTPDMWALYER
ncbi:hypothetical protein GCM10027290_45380 [Micromonospora sonneratiae]|uniref:Secreted protein n=1 Tax=Micromonospora sonneratiae TaxID=1184706 RepID=A0ABW3Y714_9ACTN